MKRKRFAALCLVSALLLALCATAASAGAIGWAKHTDIVAKINGHPLRSYNIDGYTAVVAEDLRAYGFTVYWDADARTLDIRRAVRNGELVTPDPWPSYTPQPNKYPVGSRAQTIYSTNIVTFVAGRRVDGKNIDGETLVMMDDLAPFGAVVWNEKARVIELTLGDPVLLALRPQIENLESWKNTAGSGSGYDLYPAATGTLYVSRCTGTPHGTSTGMTYYRKDGTSLNIVDLLPSYGFGASYYCQPSRIEINDPGTRLTFVTPVQEYAEKDNAINAWGDTLCTVDLEYGKMLSMQPLAEGFTDWSLSAVPQAGDYFGSTLDLAVERRGADVSLIWAYYPGDGVRVEMNSREVTVATYASMFETESVYSQAILALRALDLPNVVRGTGDARATEKQLAEMRKYFRVQLNGEYIAGNPCWSQGSNHTDLTFTFDTPLALRDGDTLTVTVTK